MNLIGFPVIRVTRDQSYISDDCFVFIRPIQAIRLYSIKIPQFYYKIPLRLSLLLIKSWPNLWRNYIDFRSPFSVPKTVDANRGEIFINDWCSALFWLNWQKAKMAKNRSEYREDCKIIFPLSKKNVHFVRLSICAFSRFKK